MTTTPSHHASIDLATHGKPYGIADVRAAASGLVSIWIGTDDARMGFGLDLSPDCARALAAALIEQADAAQHQGQAR